VDRPPNLTTGTYWIDLPCPRCGEISSVAVHLGSTLTTPDEGAPSLRVVAKAKPVDHWCGARPMLTAPAMTLMDET
jgi:hypothetical protein